MVSGFDDGSRTGAVENQGRPSVKHFQEITPETAKTCLFGRIEIRYFQDLQLFVNLESHPINAIVAHYV